MYVGNVTYLPTCLVDNYYHHHLSLSLSRFCRFYISSPIVPFVLLPLSFFFFPFPPPPFLLLLFLLLLFFSFPPFFPPSSFSSSSSTLSSARLGGFFNNPHSPNPPFPLISQERERERERSCSLAERCCAVLCWLARWLFFYRL
ncbi:hypothetical protein F5X96DRAFT_622672 [Biscogniauxia mediterranea]|nr:hypothetical protein F5X96DRAFT_622672 [Biscogniauxia mediterranea]